MIEPLAYLEQLLIKGGSSKPLWPPREEPSREFVLAVLEQARIEILKAANTGEIQRRNDLVQTAWDIAHQKNDPEYIACARWCEGLALLYSEQAKAARLFEAARLFYARPDTKAVSARIGINLVGLYSQLGQYASALELSEEIIRALKDNHDYRNWPAVYLNASMAARYAERFDEMLDLANRAEQAARRLNKGVDVPQAQINQALALCHLGRLEESLDILDGVLKGKNELYAESQARLIRSRVLQYQNRLFDALREAHQARRLFEKAGQSIDIATTANEEGLMYARLSMRKDAIRRFAMAAEEFDKAELPAERAEALINVSRMALFEQPEPARAQKTLGQLAGITQQPESIRLLREAYLRHPLLLKNKSQRKQALQDIDGLCLKLQKTGDKASLMDAEYVALLLADKRGAALRGKKIIHDARMAGYPAMERAACVELAKREKPAAARDYLLRAVSLLEQERRGISNEELKANALTGHSAVYSALVEIELTLGLPKDAANTLLKAKGGAWADMAQPGVVGTKSAEESIDPEWVELHEQEKMWADEARDGGSEQAVEHARRQLESVKSKLIERARQRAIKPNGVDVPSLDAVRQKLDKGTVVADIMLVGQKAFACLYHAQSAVPGWLNLGDLTDTANALSAFRVSLRPLQMATPKERVKLAEVTLPAVNELIDRMRQAVVEPILAWVAQNAAGVSQIRVSPDGWMYELPWSALFAGTKWHETEGVFSLTLSPALLALPKLRPAMGQPLVLGYAGNPPLEHVEEEVKAVAEHLPNAQVFYPARRSNLSWEEPPEALHIVTHGSLYPTTPLLSRLQFADGGLLLADVLRLNLRGTRLVTLSACETGALPEQGGAAMALAGAFLSAGAQAVLASQWQVDDERTQVWMNAFYENFNYRDGKDRAVKYANQKSREKTHLHPFFWAGIQAID